MPGECRRSVGRFSWNATLEQWSWDAGMYELHGYRAGAVPVSTDLVLEHKLDDDRAVAAAVLEASATTDHSFSNYHHIVDADGHQHTVLTVGQSRADLSRPTHPNRVARGFMVDVTQDESDSSWRAVEAVRRNSAPIQQSLGLLMGSFGLTEDAAFEFLARVSSHHNVKVRDLAQRFMTAAVASPAETPRDLAETLTAQAVALARPETFGSDALGHAAEYSMTGQAVRPLAHRA